MDPDTLRATWVDLVLDLEPIDEDAAIGIVATALSAGRRPIRETLKRAQGRRRVEAHAAALDLRAAGREQIDYTPEDITAQARHVERLILQRHEREGTIDQYIMFGGQISAVRVTRMEDTHKIDAQNEPAPEVAHIRGLSSADLREQVEAVALFRKLDFRSGVRHPDKVPYEILDSLNGLSAGREIPEVKGLVTHPIVAPDGTILQGNGLDRRTGLVLRADAVDEGCRAYTQAEAAEALRRIDELYLEGFEFSGKLDRTAAMAAIFTGVQRRLFDQAPGIAIMANQQGTGKTALAQRIHLILTGRDMPVVALPERNPEEISKLLFALLLASPEMVCFDNLMDGITFRSTALAQALTSPMMTQRVLQESRQAGAPTNTLFVLTGNNLGLGTDEVSRWLTVRLKSGTNPTARAFPRSNVAHALGIRSIVLKDIVGVVAGAIMDMAVQVSEARTRFKLWDAMVRQPILWAGGDDVGDVFVQNEALSESSKSRPVVLRELYAQFGLNPFSAADVKRHIEDLQFSQADKAEGLINAVEQLHVRDWHATKALGRMLGALRENSVEIEPGEIVELVPGPTRHNTASHQFKKRGD